MFKIRSLNSSHLDLVKNLIEQGVISSKEVIKAMEQVDRKFYAPRNYYIDTPQPIGYGATISAPHMHGYALQHLLKNLKKSKHVLDVGSGTGYLTVAMSLITPNDCKVYGIQHVPQLVELSLKNIESEHPELLKSQKIVIKKGDGRLGWQDQNIKFDVIHVGAAAQEIPEKLLQQLAQGGRMIIPIGSQYSMQQFVALDKIQGKIKKTPINIVRYVPLTDLNKQVAQY